MPRDLFGHVTRPLISIGNRKWYTLPLSLLSHSAIVVLLIALPILAPAVMPSVFADDDPVWMRATLPTPPTVPKPKPLHQFDPPARALSGPPTEAPTGINPEKPPPDAGWEDAKVSIGVIDGNFDTKTISSPPPVVAAPPVPIPVGGAIRAPQKLRDVNPVYPAIAQAARVQGIVIIEATIGEDGLVTNARILRSVPLLDQAAIESVRQWQFTPTTLNGIPVPVIMTVTVRFTLK